MSKPITIEKSPEWWGGTLYLQDGQVLSVAQLEKALANDPVTSPVMAGYGTKSGAGALLAGAGVGLIVAGFVTNRGPPTKAKDLGLPLAGLTTVALAVPLGISSYRQLQAAIDAHNSSLDVVHGAGATAAFGGLGATTLWAGQQCTVTLRLTF